MKKIFYIALFLFSTFAFSQNKGITYQAVIYIPGGQNIPGVDIVNSPMINKPICLKFSFIDSFSNLEYEEEVKTTTDEFGMVNLVIGTNTQTGGYASSFGTIVWNTTDKKLKVALDPSGTCSTFEEISDSPLSSVPFAYAAVTAENVSGVVELSHGGTGATTVAGARTNLGLGNIDNTSDASKPISTATQTALNAKENAANKSLDVTVDGASDVKFPTVKAVKTYVDNQLGSGSVTVVDADPATKGKIQLAGDLGGTATLPTVPGLALKENASNKSINVTTDGTSDTKYPSVKAVKTYVDTAITGTTIVDADTTTKGKIQLAGDLSGTAVLPTIATNAITTSKIADYAITDAKIATVSGTKITGNITGNAVNVTGVVGVANGGTGATIATAARTNLGLGSAATNNTSDFEVPLTINAPLVRTANAITIPAATATVNGYLNATDFTAFSNKINSTEKAANNGVATLGNDGKIPSNQIPAISFQSANVVTSQAAMIAISGAQVGSIAIRTDVNKNYVLSALPASTLSNWLELSTPTAITSVNGNAGPNVNLTKSDLVLGNVDNTNDINKPISIATQAALDLKANLASPTFTGTVSGITKAMVGLANVDNTTDAAKPVSTATQTALNLKANTTDVTTSLALKEDLSNKSTAIDLGSTNPSDVLYPSQKAVKAYVDIQSANAGVADSSITSAKILDGTLVTADLADGSVTPAKISGVLPITKGGTGATTLVGVKTNLGLENVDNTTDAAKPISTATQTALNLKANTSDVTTSLALKEDAANKTLDVATDGTSDVKFPSAKAVKTYADAKVVDGINDTVTTSAPTQNAVYDALALKANLASPTFTGTVSGIDKTMVGLGNVDNTTDTAKPISIAAQTALNLKANTSDVTTSLALKEDAANKTLDVATDGTSDVKFPSAKAVKTYADAKVVDGINDTVTTSAPTQNAVYDALVLKANLASPTFTGTVSGIDKTMVGLGNVDNTTDAAKPISTATQTALNLKANASDVTTSLALKEDAVNKTIDVTTDGTSDVKFPSAKAVKTYADAKVVDGINDTVTTSAPTQNAVYDALVLKANLASPTFTGIPTVPTAAAGNNSTQIATTAFVSAAVTASNNGVPYTGATGAVDLGAYDLKVNGITVGRGKSSEVTSTAVGYQSLMNNINTTNPQGLNNTGFGYQSLKSNTIGYSNTGVGNSVLTANTSGTFNTAIGNNALSAIATGSGNTGIGMGTLDYLTSGSDNVALGSAAGRWYGGGTALLTSNQGIFIGSGSKAKANPSSNEIVIGYNMVGNGSNTVTIGNSSVTDNYFKGNLNGATWKGAVIGNNYGGAGTSSGILKADGSGVVSAAVAGIDYLFPNAAITAGTKTKITYDTKGFVTAGSDATTADIAASTNKNYITDAQLTLLGNTSGTNSGDQTISLTGDVTGSGTGSFAATIGSGKVTTAKLAADAVTSEKITDGTIVVGDLADNAVETAKVKDANITYAKIQNVSATDKVLGRVTAGAGVIEEIATTGSGNVVRATSPSLETPNLGAASATSIEFSGATSGSATLKAPAVAGSTTITLPAVSGTLATLDGVETLKNKTLENPILTTPALGMATASMVSFEGANSGTSTITAANDAGASTIILPAVSGTLATLDGVETLTHKTLTTPVLGVATASSINKVIITPPANSATLTIADGKTLTVADDATISGTTSGTNTGDQTTITGNAGTATKLASAVNINGVAFDGSTDITVTADATTLSGTSLKSTIVGSNLTSVGTLTNLTVTNPIVGSITGNAATVTTNANLTGDVTSTGNATTVGKINGTSLSGLATGILKNTTTTGVPSIAVAADFPVLNQNTTGNAATATNIAGGDAGSIPYQTAPATTAMLAKGTDGQVLTLASGAPSWVTPSSAITLAAIGSSSNSNAATISGTTLTLQPASASFGGVVTNLAQTFGGAKTFNADIKVNSITVGKGTSNDTYSLAVGLDALSFGTTSGLVNTAIGYNSLKANSSGSANTGLGYATLQVNSSGAENTAIGFYALGTLNTSGGDGNVAVGVKALGNGQYISNNTALGSYALANASGTGTSSLSTGNTAIGYRSQYPTSGTTTANYNTSLGYYSLNNVSSGGYNVAVGNNALSGITSGANNIAIGSNAAAKLSGNVTVVKTISNSILIGNSIHPNADNETNEIVISGNEIIGLGSNSTLLGNSSTQKSQIYGALTVVPNAAAATTDGNSSTVAGQNAGSGGNNNGGNVNLTPGTSTGTGTAGVVQVNGQIKITGGTPGLGKVLTSDANGLASWGDSGSGVSSVGAISGSSTANGASITSGVLNLAPADGTNAGLVTTGGQTIAGAKTFTSVLTVSPTPAATATNGASTSIAAQTATATGFNGGGVIITAGDGVGTGSAGNINLNAGTGNSTGGDINLTPGSSPYYGKVKVNYSDLYINSNLLRVGSGNANKSTNTGIGVSVLNSVTSGGSNTAVGYFGLYSNSTGTSNTGLGSSSLTLNSSGNYNTAIGDNAMYSNTTSSHNTAIGYYSLNKNDGGTANVAIGNFAAQSNKTGSNNTAVGYQSLYATSITNTSDNTVVGYRAMYGGASGIQNTIVGSQSGYTLTTGVGNTSIGYKSLNYNTTGSYNTALGYNAGTGTGTVTVNNLTGGNSVFIGRNTQPQNDAETNEVVIAGYDGTNPTTGLGSHSTLLGNSSTQKSQIYGALTVVPNAAAASTDGNSSTVAGQNAGSGGNNNGGNVNLTPGTSTGTGTAGVVQVNGQIKITGGTPGLGRVLTSDANGLASWTNGSSVSSVGAISGIATANGASITSGVLNLAPADASNGGVITTSAQTLTGVKTFNDGVVVSKINTNEVNANIVFGYLGLGAYQNGTGSKNVVIGPSAMGNFTSGKSGSSNVAIGDQALYGNTTGSGNISLGYQTLYNNTTGESNIALGASSLNSNTTGSNNLALGLSALKTNTTGRWNVGLGAGSLENSISSYNTAIGYQALNKNTSGINDALGYSALFYNTTGTGNTAIGYMSLSTNTSGDGNVAVGNSALSSITTSSGNVALGIGAGSNILTDASNNGGSIFIGKNAGKSLTDGTGNTTGYNNIFIGRDSKPLNNGDNNEIVIGNFNNPSTYGDGSLGAGSNSTSIGNGNTTKAIIYASSSLSNLSATASSGNGGDFNLKAQDAFATGNNNGGNIVLTPGSSANSGTAGKVKAIGEFNATSIQNTPIGSISASTGDFTKITSTGIITVMPSNSVANSNGVSSTIAAQSALGPNSKNGGNLNLFAGDSSGGGNGGDLYLQVGSSSTSLNKGSILLNTTDKKLISTYSPAGVSILTPSGQDSMTIKSEADGNNMLNLWQIGSAQTNIIAFHKGSSTNVVGAINVSTTGTTYNTVSDYRLKTDFKDFDGSKLLDSIKVYDYQWKINGSRSFGVKAHELQQVLPYAVNGEKDAVNADGSILAQSVDYSKIVPVLVKAVQEQEVIIQDAKKENQLLKIQIEEQNKRLERLEKLIENK